MKRSKLMNTWPLAPLVLACLSSATISGCVDAEGEVDDATLPKTDSATNTATNSHTNTDVSLSVTASDSSTSDTNEQSITIEETGLRADAPEYARHGRHWVGHRKFLVEVAGRARPLELKAWYPALNPGNVRESLTYPIVHKIAAWQSFTPAVVEGNAIADAPVDPTSSNKGIVVFSHGYALNPEWYASLVEHFASRGFVVLAPEHLETDWLLAHEALIDRPRDIRSTLDFVESLAREDATWASALDTSRIAIVGHSFGGYTALAMAGARFDFGALATRCANLPADDPKAFLCAPFVGQEAAIATRAGLASVPQGLWPAQADARIKVAIAMAGDAYVFGEAGLASISLPTLALGGTHDFGTPWEWGAQLTYANIKSPTKAIVGLNGANHMIATTTCGKMPWSKHLPDFEQQFLCLDPVWDRDRAIDLIRQASTAFLLDSLHQDPSAHNALLAATYAYPGVVYETTIF